MNGGTKMYKIFLEDKNIRIITININVNTKINNRNFIYFFIILFNELFKEFNIL